MTICMHVRGFQATTSSMVAELPEDPEQPATIWAALGSPCASVYMPVRRAAALVPASRRRIAGVLGDEASPRRFAELRETVERALPVSWRPCACGPTGLDDLESTLWEEAQQLVELAASSHEGVTAMPGTGSRTVCDRLRTSAGPPLERR